MVPLKGRIGSSTRRLEEIQTGKVQGIPAEEVFAKAKRLIGR